MLDKSFITYRWALHGQTQKKGSESKIESGVCSEKCGVSSGPRWYQALVGNVQSIRHKNKEQPVCPNFVKIPWLAFSLFSHSHPFLLWLVRVSLDIM